MAASGKKEVNLAKSLHESSDLVQAGCQFDEEGKLTQAIKAYDEAIIIMDSVLTEIPPSADAWKVLLDIRSQYSNRLEKIRYIDVHIREAGQRLQLGRVKRRMSKIPFSYNIGPLDTGDSPPDCPPSFTPRVPFWLLKLLKKVIRQGGYLTNKVFVPKPVWRQDGAKFAGLSVKTPAYEQIIINITATIYPIEMPVDEETAEIALIALKSLTKEFSQLQNNLSKPFPFIKEVVITPDSSRLSRSSTLGAVGLLGKNVVKYAETQVQRIGVALLYAKISDEELQSFGNLAAEVCDRCQIIDEWIKFVETERYEILSAEGSHKEASTYLDPVRMELFKISAFLRDVLCELLLRDTEQLLERYLIKTRKSFARMYWEDVVEEENV